MTSRILVYGISNQKGGISEFMMGLSKNLYKKDVIFDFIIKGQDSIYSSQIEDLSGNVFYYNYKNYKERLLNLYKIMKKERRESDVFYYNTSGTYFIFPVIFAKLMNYKIISHAHNSRDKSLGRAYVLLNYVNRQILNILASIKFTCSDVAKDWVYGRSKNVIQINNAVDSSKFFYNKRIRDELRRELGVAEDEILMINIGRVEYPKNQKFLLDLMCEINKKNKKIKLLLVGNGDDYNNLIEYIKNKKIKNVYMLGQRSDVNNLLNASDIFLLPSFHEGFPIVSIEAQATGLPCLLSDKITNSSNVTNMVKFLSLSNPEDWIKNIFEIKKEKRKDMNAILIKKGFDEKSIYDYIYTQILKLIRNSYGR